MELLLAFEGLLGQYSNIAKLLAGLIVMGGLVLTYRRTVTLERRAETDTDRMQAENFTKAIDQLGHPEMAIRLGGIYALERIAKSSQDYHWPIMETLTAYVRESASAPEDVNRDGIVSGNFFIKPPVDIQAIITVLGRRETSHETADQRLDLSRCFLAGADFTGAGKNDFSRAGFQYSQLWRAHFRDVVLKDANFALADLESAYCNNANLRNVNFLKAVARNVDFDGADISGASFNMSSLEMVNFAKTICDEETYISGFDGVLPPGYRQT